MNRGGRSDHPIRVVVKRRGRAIVVAMGPPYAAGAQFGGKLTKRVPESGPSGGAHRHSPAPEPPSAPLVAALTRRDERDGEEINDRFSWQDHANCRGAGQDLFFPKRGSPTRKARAMCAACEVKAECLEFALTRGERFGIWGGLSERERRKIRGQRTLAAKRA